MHKPDYTKILEIGTWFLKRLPETSNQNLICTDEAWFTLTASINKQNDLIWVREPPMESIGTPSYLLLPPWKISLEGVLNFKRKNNF